MVLISSSGQNGIVPHFLKAAAFSKAESESQDLGSSPIKVSAGIGIIAVMWGIS